MVRHLIIKFLFKCQSDSKSLMRNFNDNERAVTVRFDE